MSKEEAWDLVLSGRKKLFALRIGEVWRFRDLLAMLVRRDIVVLYKQTILGPIWFFIQPILTALVYIIVFTRIAALSTGGAPPILFYLSGTILWSYFQDSLNGTANTFVLNANLFGKVYFPRIVVPISKIAAGLLKFLIQFSLFLAVFFVYAIRGLHFNTNSVLFLVPVFVAITGILGLGIGIILTSLTTKYRDLTFLIQFGVQLLMYGTPVVYPLSSVPDKYKAFFQLNPLTSVVEGFRYAFFGSASFDIQQLLISLTTSIVILILGIAVFNYVERDFMDTV
ncbi:MAG: ABC transporter permease [Chryseolinea sp.]